MDKPDVRLTDSRTLIHVIRIDIITKHKMTCVPSDDLNQHEPSQCWSSLIFIRKANTLWSDWVNVHFYLSFRRGYMPVYL